MKRFDRIKTLQMVLLMAAAITAGIAVFRDRALYALIATDPSAKFIALILWLTLGVSFIFLLNDFSSYSQLKRENLELDTAARSDALTGVANRYSIDVFLAQFNDKPLPRDMGAVTLIITNIGMLNKEFGHTAGDLAIQEFAGILQNASGGAHFIGRNGGNKFVVIFRDCTDSRMAKLLASVAYQVDKHNENNDHIINYACGIAFDEGDSAGSASELIAISDSRAVQAAIK